MRIGKTGQDRLAVQVYHARLSSAPGCRAGPGTRIHNPTVADRERVHDPVAGIHRVDDTVGQQKCGIYGCRGGGPGGVSQSRTAKQHDGPQQGRRELPGLLPKRTAEHTLRCPRHNLKRDAIGWRTPSSLADAFP